MARFANLGETDCDLRPRQDQGRIRRLAGTALTTDGTPFLVSRDFLGSTRAKARWLCFLKQRFGRVRSLDWLPDPPYLGARDGRRTKVFVSERQIPNSPSLERVLSRMVTARLIAKLNQSANDGRSRFQARSQHPLAKNHRKKDRSLPHTLIRTTLYCMFQNLAPTPTPQPPTPASPSQTRPDL